MHKEAYNYVFEEFHLWREKYSDVSENCSNLNILEIGSLDINGSVRDFLEPFAEQYIGIDAQEGKGVDVVVDAVDYVKPNHFDVVVCCEVFEHTPAWKQIIQNAMTNLRDGGIFITTMAGEGRPPHSAIDTGEIREWEHYSNIGEWELNQTLNGFFVKSAINRLGTDLRGWGVK